MKSKETKTSYRELDFLDRKVSKGGSSGHISIPSKYIGKRAKVSIYEELFFCEGCLESIPTSKLSEEPNLCNQCFREKEAVEKDECIKCKGKGAKKELWGMCENCWNNFLKGYEYRKGEKPSVFLSRIFKEDKTKKEEVSKE